MRKEQSQRIPPGIDFKWFQNARPNEKGAQTIATTYMRDAAESIFGDLDPKVANLMLFTTHTRGAESISDNRSSYASGVIKIVQANNWEPDNPSLLYVIGKLFVLVANEKLQTVQGIRPSQAFREELAARDITPKTDPRAFITAVRTAPPEKLINSSSFAPKISAMQERLDAFATKYSLSKRKDLDKLAEVPTLPAAEHNRILGLKA